MTQEAASLARSERPCCHKEDMINALAAERDALKAAVEQARARVKRMREALRGEVDAACDVTLAALTPAPERGHE